MRGIAIAALSLLAAACSGSKPTASGTALDVQRTEVRGGEDRAAAAGPTVTRSSRGAVLAEVRFRDHVLVIRAGSGDRGAAPEVDRALEFDVETRAGVLLARSLTRDELDRQFPAIGRHFRESTAIQLDATLHATPAGRSPLDGR
jgi:hypothetical protein